MTQSQLSGIGRRSKKKRGGTLSPSGALKRGKAKWHGNSKRQLNSRGRDGKKENALSGKGVANVKEKR